MARTWTPEQAASLAPDPASLKAGQGLATPRKWTLLGGDGDFIWGLAQGSGAQPYQAQIDLSEPAFKCSCPSRKFPCKHGLGLLLIFASGASAIPAGDRPAWVAEWAAKRAEKAAKQEAKHSPADTVAAGNPGSTSANANASSPASASAPVVDAGAATPPSAAANAEAQARRREKREANIAHGVAFLDGWLRDLARQGLAATASAGYEFWDAPARRLVDAQAPGLARRVRELAGISSADDGAGERAIAELGRVYLLVSASARRATLPPDWRREIDAQLGWTIEQDELRKRDGARGAWFVGAQTVREDDKLVARSSYLFSHDGAVAQLLEFSPAARPSVASLALGRWFDGELIFFPGVGNRRALWKTPPQDSAGGRLAFLPTCEDVLAAHAAALAENPLAEALPALVRLTPVRHGERWWLRDDTGGALPIAEKFPLGWELLACSGGRPLDLAGLWDGFAFTPLTAFTDAGLLQLATRASVS